MSDELMELPEGWKWTTAIEACSKVIDCHNKTAPYTASGIKLVRTSNIRNGQINLDDTKFVAQPTYEFWSRRCPPEPRDILFTREAPMAEVGMIPDGEKLCMGQRMMLLRADNKSLSAKYLLYALQTPFISSYADEVAVGTGVKHLRVKAVEQLPIPLPPLNEQKRIVAEIEALRERSQKARSVLSAIPELCDKFRQSVLAAAFRGDLTADWREQNPDVESASTLLERIRKEKIAALSNYKEPELTYEEDLPELPHTWTWAVPEALSAYESNAICAGPFGTIFKAKDFRDEGIPIIFLRHIAPGKYLTHKPGFMDVNKWEELFKPYSIWGGELLITKLGEPPGACAIYPENIGPAMVTPDVIKMSANRNGAESLYLMHYFNSEFSKKITFGVAYGVTRLRMNLSIFRSLPVPLAPLEEQREVCKVIQKFFQIADYVEQQHLNIENQLNQLDRSILAKAFRGELVEQDPNDEPASVLLERIRLDREQQMQGKIKKPGKKKRTGD